MEYLDLLHLTKVKQLLEVIVTIADDQRIPTDVREELMDKVNNILEG